MKITFPHLGTLQILLSDLFERLEVETIAPPPTTTRTLSLGARVSPEFACLPLKITIGNLIEGLESGADAVVMVGGLGPCRFGFYAEIQKRILQSLGYQFEMLTIEPPEAGWRDFIRQCRRVAGGKSVFEIFRAFKTGWKKAVAVDELEKKVLQTRAYEKNRGDVSKARKQALEILNRARTDDEIKKARDEALSLIDSVEKNLEKIPLKVGIVGEFYLLLEPFANFDIEEFLGNKGIYVAKSVYLTDWLDSSGKNPVMGITDEEIIKAARPYLSHFVGGEGQATIGHIVKFAEEGFDGIVHLLPFTCMPEIIAKSIYHKITRDHGIPILTLVIDEQTGKAGVHTRLEAFIDLMESKRKKQIDKRLVIN